MTDKTSVDDITGIVKTEEPTNSIQLKKEAQLSICEKRIIELEKENEQLKEALREELQDNGNSYYVNLFDELFNLNYREWDKNERYRECTDWEKILKEKGDVE